jgi:hypothetical protein
MMRAEIAFSEYIKEPVYDELGQRKTLGESLAEADSSILPQRKADDVSDLVNFFDKLIFIDNRLSDQEENYYNLHVVVPHRELKKTLGNDFLEHYSYRDWNDALKDVLETRCKKTFNYGDHYRTILNFDGNGSLFIGVNGIDEGQRCTRPGMCKNSSYRAIPCAGFGEA